MELQVWFEDGADAEAHGVDGGAVDGFGGDEDVLFEAV